MRPKSFALLQYLVSHPGRVITKDELLTAVWPKVIVTEDSLTHCIGEIRSALGEAGQKAIKTVTKRGYLFSQQVLVNDSPVPDDLFPGAEPATLVVAIPRRRLVNRWFVLVGAMFLALVMAVWVRHDSTTVPPRLSLVVLPFVNIGGDPMQGYWADVVSNDLTAALSRLRGATVIAPGSSFALDPSKLDAKQLGSGLGVRYAVQGSVLPADGRLRISARLIDTVTAATLWSEQFDSPRANLLQTLDEISTRLATALDAELVRADSQRSAREGANLDAEDLAMQCDAAWFRLGAQAKPPSFELCERALGIDPRNVRALVRLATFHANRVSRVQSPDVQADIARANEFVQRALDADPDYYAAHCAKAMALEAARRVHEAIAAGERCLALNPSNAAAYRILATNYFFLARPEKTLELVERGIKISPVDVQMQSFLLFKGWAYFMMARDEEALAWLRQAAAAAPENPPIQAALASILALSGNDKEAHAALARYMALPTTRTRAISQWDFMPDDNVAFRQFDARFKSGLRRAGMPEH